MPNVKRLGVLDFNPRAPCGARLYQSDTCQEHNVFQSTRPLRGATRRPGRDAGRRRISIHAPLAGRDPQPAGAIFSFTDFNPRAPCGARPDTVPRVVLRCSYFNPRAPCGARLSSCHPSDGVLLFQSTRPLRGATSDYTTEERYSPISIHAPLAGRDAANAAFCLFLAISIHAPLAGRDQGATRLDNERLHFNPRAPCGARLGIEGNDHQTPLFQSTRPLRGATSWYSMPWASNCYFNPRAPCGARQWRSGWQAGCSYFNPRAPCGARLRPSGWLPRRLHNFNPRAPCGARHPSCCLIRLNCQYFNPRAPCGARLHRTRPGCQFSYYFNPRAPCGARHATSIDSAKLKKFQSTRPLRGATLIYQAFSVVFRISIHAPLAGRDDQSKGGIFKVSGFQSTRPLRGATSFRITV